MFNWLPQFHNNTGVKQLIPDPELLTCILTMLLILFSLKPAYTCFSFERATILDALFWGPCIWLHQRILYDLDQTQDLHSSGNKLGTPKVLLKITPSLIMHSMLNFYCITAFGAIPAL